MAKTQFHKNQKVWVESVGAWSVIERIMPVWAKGFDEPVRITYDVGLGREFLGHELTPEPPTAAPGLSADEPKWRILRARNKWQAPQDCAHHPDPGSFPVVVTDENDWGGWRVPGAEYDRSPDRIEAQARAIEQTPRLLRLAQALAALASELADDAPASLLELSQEADAILGLCGGQTAPVATAGASPSHETAAPQPAPPAPRKGQEAQTGEAANPFAFEL